MLLAFTWRKMLLEGEESKREGRRGWDWDDAVVH